MGATATAVAAQRAAASKHPNPLISDPLAEQLVSAVGLEFFTKLARGELADVEIDDPAMDLDRMAEHLAVRTKYFDEFFRGAMDAGIRQVVILASGLDSRAYRLPWPSGTTLFELDQPRVIEFKTRTLAGIGVKPTWDRRPVAIDLRDDWPTALLAAGFEPTQPTAWLTEGLLGYLPPEARDRLLDDIARLSARGSRLGTESMPDLTAADREQMRERSRRAADQWRASGYELDITELVYFGERNETAAYLNRRGWQTAASTNAQLFVTYGLRPLGEDESPFGDVAYISAALN